MGFCPSSSDVRNEGFVPIISESGLWSVCFIQQKRRRTGWKAGRVLYPTGSDSDCFSTSSSVGVPSSTVD